MKIGRHDLDERVLLIAEIGNNHEGDVAAAIELVHAAAEAGADAVKLQTFRTEQFVSAANAERFAMLERFRLPDDAVLQLHGLAHELGLLFLSTPLDLESARFLAPLVDAFKIASADNAFFPLLDEVAAFAKPVVVSAGLSDLDRVRTSVDRLRSGSVKDVLVLHCVTAYPAEPAETNLASIAFLERELGCPVGYSDHTLGIEVCALAVAAGARAIEKHVTLDKGRSSFRDHALSADPDELRALVERVRWIEEVVGRPGKRVQPSELALADAVARSTVAARDLGRGHVVTRADLMWTRPGGGIPPGGEDALVGRALLRDVALGERLLPTDVE